MLGQLTRLRMIYRDGTSRSFNHKEILRGTHIATPDISHTSGGAGCTALQTSLTSLLDRLYKPVGGQFSSQRVSTRHVFRTYWFSSVVRRQDLPCGPSAHRANALVTRHRGGRSAGSLISYLS